MKKASKPSSATSHGPLVLLSLLSLTVVCCHGFQSPPSPQGTTTGRRRNCESAGGGRHCRPLEAGLSSSESDSSFPPRSFRRRRPHTEEESTTRLHLYTNDGERASGGGGSSATRPVVDPEEEVVVVIVDNDMDVELEQERQELHAMIVELEQYLQDADGDDDATLRHAYEQARQSLQQLDQLQQDMANLKDRQDEEEEEETDDDDLDDALLYEEEDVDEEADYDDWEEEGGDPDATLTTQMMYHSNGGSNTADDGRWGDVVADDAPSFALSSSSSSSSSSYDWDPLISTRELLAAEPQYEITTSVLETTTISIRHVNATATTTPVPTAVLVVEEEQDPLLAQLFPPCPPQTRPGRAAWLIAFQQEQQRRSRKAAAPLSSPRITNNNNNNEPRTGTTLLPTSLMIRATDYLKSNPHKTTPTTTATTTTDASATPVNNNNNQQEEDLSSLLPKESVGTENDTQLPTKSIAIGGSGDSADKSSTTTVGNDGPKPSAIEGSSSTVVSTTTPQEGKGAVAADQAEPRRRRESAETTPATKWAMRQQLPQEPLSAMHHRPQRWAQTLLYVQQQQQEQGLPTATVQKRARTFTSLPKQWAQMKRWMALTHTEQVVHRAARTVTQQQRKRQRRRKKKKKTKEQHSLEKDAALAAGSAPTASKVHEKEQGHESAGSPVEAKSTVLLEAAPPPPPSSRNKAKDEKAAKEAAVAWSLSVRSVIAQWKAAAAVREAQQAAATTNQTAACAEEKDAEAGAEKHCPDSACNASFIDATAAPVAPVVESETSTKNTAAGSSSTAAEEVDVRVVDVAAVDEVMVVRKRKTEKQASKAEKQAPKAEDDSKKPKARVERLSAEISESTDTNDNVGEPILEAAEPQGGILQEELHNETRANSAPAPIPQRSDEQEAIGETDQTDLPATVDTFQTQNSQSKSTDKVSEKPHVVSKEASVVKATTSAEGSKVETKATRQQEAAQPADTRHADMQQRRDRASPSAEHNLPAKTDAGSQTSPIHRRVRREETADKQLAVDKTVQRKALISALVPGRELKTWSFQKSSIRRVHLVVQSQGRPLSAHVELQQNHHGGQSTVPQKLSFYSENGQLRPCSVVIDTPGRDNALAVANTGHAEFPLTASVEADTFTGSTAQTSLPIAPRIAHTSIAPQTLQGGSGVAIRSFRFGPNVASVQVLLKTDGRPLNARIEVLQGTGNGGSDDIKQAIEAYIADGKRQTFFAVLETPGSGSVVRIVNTGYMELPAMALVQPYRMKKGIPTADTVAVPCFYVVDGKSHFYQGGGI